MRVVFWRFLAVVACGPEWERKCDSLLIVHRRHCTDGAHCTRPRAYLAITLYLLRPRMLSYALLILDAPIKILLKLYFYFFIFVIYPIYINLLVINSVIDYVICIHKVKNIVL